MQSLLVVSAIAQSFYWNKAPLRGDALCTVAARITMAPFFKPLVAPVFQIFISVMLDSSGGLHRNVLTETLVAVQIIIFGIWLVVAFMFSAPLVFEAFCFLGLALVMPPFVHLRLAGDHRLYEDTRRKIISHDPELGEETFGKPEFGFWSRCFYALFPSEAKENGPYSYSN